MSSTAQDGPGGPLRYFSGESEDSLEYKRWKTWVQNKLLTLDKLPKEAYGSYIYTLLAGKALECVEHLEATEYQRAGGEKVLWELLDERFPQKETTDILGETLGEVFSLQAKSGESLKTWVARATELFERCDRRTKVSFPSAARGWILLHRAGLSEEQKAVILARAQGLLDRDKIAVAMRSCYPDLICKGSIKSNPIHVVEDAFVEDEMIENDLLPEVEFADVELLLSEHQLQSDAKDSSEVFGEPDVAEVLAMSWKDKRAELNKLQKARKFTAAKDLKRSFRIEVEELKRKTRCHRCGRQGHWSRECNMPRREGDNSKGARSSNPRSTTGAAMVQAESLDFIAFVASEDTPRSLLEQVRQHVAGRGETSNHHLIKAEPSCPSVAPPFSSP